MRLKVTLGALALFGAVLTLPATVQAGSHKHRHNHQAHHHMHHNCLFHWMHHHGRMHHHHGDGTPNKAVKSKRKTKAAHH